MIMCASHINRKISYSTFEFWIDFKNIFLENIQFITNFEIIENILNIY